MEPERNQDERVSKSPSVKSEPDAIILNEVQLVLAEKRTSLSVMRTGIAVFALPLSVLSVLIATSKHYDILHVLPLLVPLLILCVILIGLGFFLVVRAILRLHHYDELITSLKKKNRRLAEYID